MLFEYLSCLCNRYLHCQGLLQTAGCLMSAFPFAGTFARTGSQKWKVRENSGIWVSLRKAAVASLGSRHCFPSAKTLYTLGSCSGMAGLVGGGLWLRTDVRNHLVSPSPGRALRERPQSASHKRPAGLLFSLCWEVPTLWGSNHTFDTSNNNTRGSFQNITRQDILSCFLNQTLLLFL